MRSTGQFWLRSCDRKLLKRVADIALGRSREGLIILVRVSRVGTVMFDRWRSNVVKARKPRRSLRSTDFVLCSSSPACVQSGARRSIQKDVRAGLHGLDGIVCKTTCKG